MLRLSATFCALAIAAQLILCGGADARRTSPVDGGTLTSGVGWRLDPFGSGKMLYHHGYDIAVPTGTPVYPVEAGTVYFAGTYKGYGELVAVDHGNGYLTLYGHNSEVKVKRGDRVDCKMVIALSGSSGRSTGPHVHYELRELPGQEKLRRARLESDLKKLVAERIDGWVEEEIAGGKGVGLAGNGGKGGDLYLPEDLDE